jgi:nitronate monooxygenase
MILDRVNFPIVLAPLAGGPSTPELTAAVSGAGGLGFLAAGYLSSDELARRIARTRSLSAAPFGVNVFVPGDGPTERAAYERYLDRLRAWAAERNVALGEPRYSDDDWDAKLALLRADPVELVSFTFGSPAPDDVAALKAAGSEVWVSVTSPEEARLAEEIGADALVVQGAEAGGHRASFQDRAEAPVYSLLPLLALIRETTSLPLVASGGIATPASVAAALAAGAAAAQIGTAFMLAPEAGTSPAHREALKGSEPTVLTRAFSGRLARGIRNGFIEAHDSQAPIAYPEIHYVTSPMRAQAREHGNAELINLWAGEAHQLAHEQPAAEIVESLGAGARAALSAAARPQRNPGSSEL